MVHSLFRLVFSNVLFYVVFRHFEDLQNFLFMACGLDDLAESSELEGVAFIPFYLVYHNDFLNLVEDFMIFNSQDIINSCPELSGKKPADYLA